MVMGDNSCLKGCGFESQRRKLDGHFFTLICCKNCIICLKKTKNKLKKRPGLAHFLKKYALYILHLSATATASSVLLTWPDFGGLEGMGNIRKLIVRVAKIFTFNPLTIKRKSLIESPLYFPGGWVEAML